MEIDGETDHTVSKVTWTGRVISVLMMLPFMMSAMMKFRGGEELAKSMATMGLSNAMLIPLGIIEIFCVIIYLIPHTAVLGAILFTGYMGGTIITHWRMGEAPMMQILFGLLIWLGIYLREPRLRDVLPLRKLQ